MSVIIDLCLGHEAEIQGSAGFPDQESGVAFMRACPEMARSVFLRPYGLCGPWWASVLSVIKWECLPYRPLKAILRTDGQFT